MSDQKISNREIAQVLDQIAELLDARVARGHAQRSTGKGRDRVRDANPFRVRAYRNGAQVVRAYERPVAELVERGDGNMLRELPQIGEGLAAVIAEYVTEGRSRVLEELQSEVGPAGLFASVPGIGKTLAKRIVDELQIDTLEELERAANDGHLARVEGFGEKRVETARAGLNEMLSRSARRRRMQLKSDGRTVAEPKQPEVAMLLDVDAEYRRRAEQDELQKIAPRRFNPEREAWLPILHTERDGWEFTAMYSNTAQAHELNKTRDWVVIYFERDREGEQQVTVTTPATGKLKGKRVVRGREVESARSYQER
jgi:DNA polymerase (family X)